MFMIQDESKDKEETWEFLDRRLDDAQQIGQNLVLKKHTVEAMGVGFTSILNMIKEYNYNTDDTLIRQ